MHASPLRRCYRSGSLSKQQSHSHSHSQSHPNPNSRRRLSSSSSGTQSQPRHFVALVPPSAVLDALESLQSRLKPQFPLDTLRWVSRENLHVTLRFLGSALDSPEKVQGACLALTRALAATPPWELTLKSLGVFPHANKPRVLWVGLADAHSRLKALRHRFELELRAAGVTMAAAGPREDEAHLTLARWNDVYVKKSEGDRVLSVARDMADSAVASWQLREALLVHSSLTESSAPIYTPVHVAQAQRDAPLDPRRRRTR